MSVLTKQERDGLDDVFLSIHTQGEKYQKFKEISTLIITHKVHYNFSKLMKQVKHKLKRAKITHFLGDIPKKKKNLSK